MSAMAQGADLILLSEDDNPPYNFTSPITHAFTGMSTEIVVEMMKRANITYELQILPWQRGFRMALEQPNVCIFAANLTEERRPLFKWVGPFILGSWVLFAKSDSKIAPLNQLDEAKQYRIAGRLGDAPTLYLESLGGFQLESVPDNTRIMKMLQSGRIELWFGGGDTVRYRAKLSGVAIKPVFRVGESKLGMACNQQVADGLIKAMNDALATMRSDDSLNMILAHYR